MGGCVLAIHSDRFAKILESADGLARMKVRQPAIDDHRGVCRIDGQGGIEVAQGGRVVRAIEVEHTPVVEDVGIEGLEFEGAVVVAQGRFEFARAGVGVGTVVVGSYEFAIHLNGGAVAFDGELVLAHVEVDVSFIEVGFGGAAWGRDDGQRRDLGERVFERLWQFGGTLIGGRWRGGG